MPKLAGQGDPSARLAEAHRREGRPEEAMRTARAGLAERPDAAALRVALALALLDLGRLDEARTELERLLGERSGDAPMGSAPGREPEGVGPAAEAPASPPSESVFGALENGELERAFEAATPERDSMLDADRIALEAVRKAEQGEPELPPEPGSPFATETVAELLEQQGDQRGANAVRRVLAERDRFEPSSSQTPPPAAPGGSAVAHRAQLIATLERWLERLSRGDP